LAGTAWLRVMNEMKNRGLSDILIAVVDGLKGFSEAINAVFPQTVVQTCIVHLIRHSLEFVSWKDRKAVVPALRAIYRAKDAEAGMKALEAFEAGDWGPISGDRTELAAQLGPRDPFLRLPRKCAPDHLHDERDRSVELEAAACSTNQGTLPQ
jgi:transposase-like protein